MFVSERYNVSVPMLLNLILTKTVSFWKEMMLCMIPVNRGTVNTGGKLHVLNTESTVIRQD